MEPFWLLLLFLLQRTLPQKGIEPYCYYSYCSYCKRGSNPTAEGDRTLSAIATIPIAAIAKGDRTLPQKGIEPYWLLLLFLLQLSKGDRTLLLLLLLQLLQKGIEPYLLLLLFLLQVLQKGIEPYRRRGSNPIAAIAIAAIAKGDRTLLAIAAIPIAGIAKADRTLLQKGIEPYCKRGSIPF